MINKLTIDKAEYLLLKNAFAGGFTHCNAMYTEMECKNVTSYDFTSSYPTVLIAEKYPLSNSLSCNTHKQIAFLGFNLFDLSSDQGFM
mgnify:CR=1 FL=1